MTSQLTLVLPIWITLRSITPLSNILYCLELEIYTSFRFHIYSSSYSSIICFNKIVCWLTPHLSLLIIQLINNVMLINSLWTPRASTYHNLIARQLRSLIYFQNLGEWNKNVIQIMFASVWGPSYILEYEQYWRLEANI